MLNSTNLTKRPHQRRGQVGCVFVKRLAGIQRYAQFQFWKLLGVNGHHLNIASLLDLTMGSFDGEEFESCELVGSYLLHLITTKHDGNNFGLYRDDGLGAIKATAREIEISKMICIPFSPNTGSKSQLNVTLNLSTGKYQAYAKPNNTPLYVHKKSNHPPNIPRNIPLSVNKCLAA
jgi:hypothetical protein